MLTSDQLVAIQQLQARYGHLVDAADWDALREMFTDDAELDLTAYGIEPIQGIEAVMGFYTTMTHPSVHHLTNVEAWAEDGTIRARSKWFIAHADGRMAGGDYEDVLVEAGTTWQIARRVTTRRWPDAVEDVA